MSVLLMYKFYVVEFSMELRYYSDSVLFMIMMAEMEVNMLAFTNNRSCELLPYMPVSINTSLVRYILCYGIFSVIASNITF